jgi:hypothetical protein
MITFQKILLCASMATAITAAVSIRPIFAAQISEDMGKCMQKEHGFKDKMCACKDSACAQKNSAAQGNPTAPGKRVAPKMVVAPKALAAPTSAGFPKANRIVGAKK